MSVPDELLGTHEVVAPEAMEELGRRLGAALVPGDLLVLTGPLGAGKTTLTRGIGAGLGVRGPVQSPTFVIARTHPSLIGGAPLVHVDAYRLGSAVELDDLDIDLSGSVVVVEWGRDMVDGLAEHWWEVELDREWHGRGWAHAPSAPRDSDARSGRGDDIACGAHSRQTLDLDADTPRLVTITRRP